MTRMLVLAAALASTLALPAVAFAHEHDGWHGGGYGWRPGYGGWGYAGFGGYGFHGGCVTKWSYTYDRPVVVC